MAVWLMKTEPDVFSIDDLVKAAKKTAPWEGVRNYQARNFMKTMEVGDLVYIYHSSCETPGIFGKAIVAKLAYPDPTAFDAKSDYYDAKSDPKNPRWFMVDVAFQEKLAKPLLLSDLKNYPELKDFTLLKRGNRLSVFPVQAPYFKVLEALSAH